MRSSVKPSHAANDNLIDRTRQVWQPRLGRDLSREDARQIAENVTGFFALLAEWSRADLARPRRTIWASPPPPTTRKRAMNAEDIAKSFDSWNTALNKVPGLPRWLAR